MKANDFIRDYGLGEAKRVLRDAHGCVSTKLWGKYEFKNEDLKRLVESHELVEKLGGIDGAKSCYQFDGGPFKAISLTLPGGEEIQIEVIKQAVVDVDSCL